MKKLWSYALMAALSVTVLTGCKTSTSASSDTSAATVEAASETANDEAASKEDTSSENTSPETDASREETSAAVSDTENSEENDNENEDDIEIEAVDQNGAQIRIGSLKGPTSMGLVFLMEMSENGKTANDYEFTMVTAAANWIWPFFPPMWQVCFITGWTGRFRSLILIL